MKKILVFLLIVISSYAALAQNTNNIYADVGVNSFGFSATYDRKLARHFDLGVGVNTYNFSDETYAKIRSALYLDLRRFRNIKRSLLFGFLDIGGALNSGKEPDSATIAHVSLYTTIAGGYCYQVNKRGMGPYVTVGFYGYTETIHRQNAFLSQRGRDYSVLDATLLLSVGFKF